MTLGIDCLIIRNRVHDLMRFCASPLRSRMSRWIPVGCEVAHAAKLLARLPGRTNYKVERLK